MPNTSISVRCGKRPGPSATIVFFYPRHSQVMSLVNLSIAAGHGSSRSCKMALVDFNYRQRKLNPSPEDILGSLWYHKGSSSLHDLNLKIPSMIDVVWELAGVRLRSPDSPAACDLVCSECRAVRSSNWVKPCLRKFEGTLAPQLASVHISSGIFLAWSIMAFCHLCQYCASTIKED